MCVKVSTSLLMLLALTSGCASVSPQATNPLARFEQSLIFAPTRFPDGRWTPPEGLPVEDAWFAAEDDTRLHGWYCSHPTPVAHVLFCHGNAGNLTDRAALMQQLHDQHRVAVLMFDYRGYGRSEGKPSEKGVMQDARAARAWLAQRANVVEQDIVLMGRSLGGAVAIDLAAQDGARGLILESTFTSLPDVASRLAWWAAPKLTMQTRLNSLAKIGNYHGPLLYSHGSADRLIPFGQGEKLFAAANEPKHFVTIEGGDHNDPQSAEYYRQLDHFLAALPD